MPRHDYQCPVCPGRLTDFAMPNVESGHELSLLWPQCPRCGWEMERLPSAPNFTVKGFNAKNGYAK